ncbi:DUF2306 domain-containing protein [Neobacillus sp. PS3-34]|uniref:DUF2306 domain-containing protein n=1 Tax=Neobacillus sp. PS3-34 TaxID=3070678 RepID=UPI0027E1043F|nr:DUF2306 domain-containing protein [Neobacillus sp. PS3-34]WML48055.1 DUF2306 domain-containing protein [Neobacillus sp. PS3-34]
MNKYRFRVAGVYLMILLFTAYIFFMYLLNGAEHAPILEGKMKDAGFTYSTYKLFFYPHLLLGIIALSIGPFQFLKASRKKINLHKILGRIYAFTILINVLLVPYISLFSTGGTGSMIAFLVLDAFWLFTTSIGILRIYQRKLKQHQEWMKRSYAITLVFVSFRIIVIPLSLLLDSSIAFPVGVLISIAVNLAAAEWIINRKQPKKVPSKHLPVI